MLVSHNQELALDHVYTCTVHTAVLFQSLAGIYWSLDHAVEIRKQYALEGIVEKDLEPN
jgi:hypothetical protein